jgi:hypothetical protein
MTSFERQCTGQLDPLPFDIRDRNPIAYEDDPASLKGTLTAKPNSLTEVQEI